MDKVDLKKELKHLYQPSAKQVVAVDVPPLRYLMIDGRGDPVTTPAYADAIKALYSVSYTLKFAVKKGDPAIDYHVMPLEGLWWADDMSAFLSGARDDWRWTAMILQPAFVGDGMVAAATDEVRRKKDPVALSAVRFEELAEGRAAQIMHIGPFSEEGPTIAKVRVFIAAQGSEPRGKHHEIYLSDPRRTDAARLKTVIRQPMT